MNGGTSPFPEDLRRFVDDERWTFAKTMPEWPHEYLVRERVDEKLFERVVRHIRSHGYEGRFYQKKITYYDEAGLVYWTMGAPLGETTIINRCRKEDSFEYRSTNLATLERAIIIAAQAHAGKVDKGGAPYILHPLRVMLTMDTLEERIVAVLHDVVEDTPWTFDRLRAEGFAESVMDALEAVTRREGESYEDFIRRAAKNPIGRTVKRADLLDNLDLSRIQVPTTSDHDRVAKYRNAMSLLDSTIHHPKE